VAIRSEPSGATVYRAGKRLGETPLQLRVKPEEDIVRVELRHPGYQPLAAELTAVDGTRMLALTPVHTGKRPRRTGPQHAGSRASAPGPAAQPATPTSKPSGGPYERFE
jgi:hypothetical protein